ncbi:hypothetical protein TWF696_001570 [Orbilia brochopaga]|uniref:Uncharacterized protein n=1 Tax=Orbilia brochopaga TaxID=3140254 RepID=A0AAV9UCM2_9PEZI
MRTTHAPPPIEAGYDRLSDIPSTFSPTAESAATSEDILNSPLPATLSPTFIFPHPASSFSISTSSGAGFSEYSAPAELPDPTYPGNLRRTLEAVDTGPRGGSKVTQSTGAAELPELEAGMGEGTFAPTVTFLVAAPYMPTVPATRADLLLGAVYFATFLRLLAHITSATPNTTLSSEVVIFLTIICAIALLAWFASAGPAVTTGWVRWGVIVSLRFAALAAAAYCVRYTVCAIGNVLCSRAATGDIDSIVVTIPSGLKRRHMLDVVRRLQAHVKERMGFVHADMVKYVNGYMAGIEDEGVREGLRKVYEGLIALGGIDAGVLVDVLAGLWGGNRL